MDRYDSLDLDLECEETAEADKRGVFKGLFKKTTKAVQDQPQNMDLEDPELSASSISLISNKSTTEKSSTSVLGGILRSPKPGNVRRLSRDLLESEMTASNDGLSETSSAKESMGRFKGMFKKNTKLLEAKTQSEDDLLALCSADSLSVNKKDLLENELTASNYSLSETSSAKESTGVFLGIFKKNSKLLEAKTQSENDLLVLGSADSLAVNNKEAGGMFTGLFKKKKSHGAGTRAQNDSSAASELSGSSDNLSKNNNDEKNSGSDSEEALDNGEMQPVQKPWKFTEGIAKMNPFRGANRKDTKHAHKNESQPKENCRAAQSDDENLRDEDLGQQEEKKSGESKDKTDETKVRKPKRHNPFMPRVKALSDDEELRNEDAAHQEEKESEEMSKDRIDQTKVKKPKKHNPFMPRVKGKMLQRHANTAENEEGSRSLFDQLEDFRIEPSPNEDRENMDNLMDWWNTVESWEDTPEVEDMTEKEEAKAFAVTAEKIQKGIRVFNKLFSERAESLWQHVIDLNSIADGLDKFSKNTKIAQITGGSTSAIGGVATIAGLALAPVTMGTSLIVTAVGLGVATAGGLTSAGAGITNQVNNSMDRKKVEKIVQDYQDKIADLNKCLKFIKQGIENLKKFDLVKMKHHAYNRDFPVLSSSFYEDGAMAGKAILINANEIMRVVQIANVAGSTAARAVQIASMATGVLTGLFVGMDIYFVAKDSKELKKGVKSEFAAKIREVATQLHDGLVELNSIREELQSSSPESKEVGSDASDENREDDHCDSDKDEIDRIKKAIKKNVEN
eukprot:XP_011615334.1 PREDICTED: uncharacterized protein LOC105418219 isoform X4 [Takifugu rubripes]